MYENPSVRAAYRQGARECYLSIIPNLNPANEREIVAWLAELDEWKDGAPPLPPHAWGKNVVPLR